MSSINSLSTSQYYQLPTGQSQADGTGTSTNALESELASILNSEQGNNTNNVSDVLDLSPQAQNILSGLNIGTGTTNNSSANVLGDSSSDASFTLTAAQQQKITQILSEYAGQPMTQANYDKLQNDLNAAGLGPDQLSAKDSIQSFNPTQVFIDALNGITDPITDPAADSSTEQTKAANYMAQIVSEWQNMSGKASSASSSTGVTATSNTGAS